MQTAINRRQLMRRLAALSLGSSVLPLSSFTDDLLQEPAGPGVVHIPAGGGKHGKVGEMEIQFKLSGSQTASYLGSWESIIQPGELGAPPHYHSNTDEICRVLEGTVMIMTGDEVTEVKAGGWHLRPRGVVHTFWNSGKLPAKTIDICIPSGHEDYMQELAAMFENGKRPGYEEMMKMEKKYDIHYRYDLLKGVMEKYGVRL